MLLESRIDDRTILVIDAESVGGIDKGSLTVHSHPDKIMTRTVEIIRAVATQVVAAVDVGAASPTEMEVDFAVRVDSNATVALSRKADEGQFHVTLRWKK